MRYLQVSRKWTNKYNESYEKAINRNWSNQKANPSLNTKMGNNQKSQIDKIQWEQMATEWAAISQKVVTKQPKPN